MKQLIINNSSSPGLDIGKAMNEKGISESSLATLTGYSRQSIYRYTSGPYPMKLETIERIGRALGADEIVIKIRR